MTAAVFSRAALAAALESTLLRPDTTADEIADLCREADRMGVAGVCVPPARVAQAAGLLAASPVRVVTVIGFPLGYAATSTKCAEIGHLVREGADEVDMVINLGWAREGAWGRLADELRRARDTAGEKVWKVILETGALTDDQRDRAALCALEAGADHLKTSTGFGPRGASVEDVRRLAALAGGRAGVKASGGIRDRPFALALLRAGADRIGTSSARAILEGS